MSVVLASSLEHGLAATDSGARPGIFSRKGAAADQTVVNNAAMIDCSITAGGRWWNFSPSTSFLVVYLASSRRIAARFGLALHSFILIRRLL